MDLDKNRWKEPGFGRIVLGAVALGCAILVGFVLGLRSGDRHRKQPPVNALLSLSMPLPMPSDSADSAAAANMETADADTVEVVPAVSVAEPRPKYSQAQIAQGVEYLASHNRWNRDEMEKIPALTGLWDAVNTYQLDEIRQYNEALSSTPLTAVVEGLEKKPKKGYYAAKTDQVITLSTYIKRLR